jgi:hypothetical protein
VVIQQAVEVYEWLAERIESGAKNELHPTDDRGQKTDNSKNSKLKINFRGNIIGIEIFAVASA